MIHKTEKFNMNSSMIVGCTDELLKVTGYGVGIKDAGVPKIKDGQYEVGLRGSVRLKDTSVSILIVELELDQ